MTFELTPFTIRIAMGVAVLPCLLFAIVHASAYGNSVTDPNNANRKRPESEWKPHHWWLGMLWLGVAIGLGVSAILWSVSDREERGLDAYRTRIDAESRERTDNDHERFRQQEQGRVDAHLGLPYESSGLTGWRQEAWAAGWREQKRGGK